MGGTGAGCCVAICLWEVGVDASAHGARAGRGDDGAPLKDTGVPDVFKGPLAIVDESKLGCPGDVAVDGTPVDLTASLGGFVFSSDATLVPLNDGTYRMR